MLVSFVYFIAKKKCTAMQKYQYRHRLSAVKNEKNQYRPKKALSDKI